MLSLCRVIQRCLPVTSLGYCERKTLKCWKDDIYCSICIVVDLCYIGSECRFTLFSRRSSTISRFSLSIAMRSAERPKGSTQSIFICPVSLQFSSILQYNTYKILQYLCSSQASYNIIFLKYYNIFAVLKNPTT